VPHYLKARSAAGILLLDSRLANQVNVNQLAKAECCVCCRIPMGMGGGGGTPPFGTTKQQVPVPKYPNRGCIASRPFWEVG
jgi:hypothetical protein